MSDDPVPFTLADTAVALHEMYLSLMKAGFSKAQSFHLVAQMLFTSQRPSS